MGSHIRCQEESYRRARLEFEINQRDLSLRKIVRNHVHLAARLAECRVLQRRIARRLYQSGSSAGRSDARIRRFG